jgi:Fe-S-cluster containining protein
VRMISQRLLEGPLGGYATPVHGGTPRIETCNGCTDCCHLPEISVTDEEAGLLRQVAEDVEVPNGELVFEPDRKRSGWQLMQGPCPFRALDSPGLPGGCRIYEHRPGSCRVFTCSSLLDLRRRLL